MRGPPLLLFLLHARRPHFSTAAYHSLRRFASVFACFLLRLHVCELYTCVPAVSVSAPPCVVCLSLFLSSRLSCPFLSPSISSHLLYHDSFVAYYITIIYLPSSLYPLALSQITLLFALASPRPKFRPLQKQVLGIDEGQFFPDIVPFCEDMANAGKLVIVAALDGTFQRKVCSSV